MQKIFNWTIGSFFRSIGRIFAYLVIGGIISYLLYSNTNIRITDLLGIQKVSAKSGSVWLGEVIQNDNTWYYSGLSPIYVERQVRTYTTYMGSVQFETNFGEYGVDRFYVNGYIGSVDLDNYYNLCSEGDSSSGYCRTSSDRLADLQFQLWLGNNSNQCKITYNIPSISSVGQTGYLFWSAECFSDDYTTTNSIGYRIQMVDPNSGTDSPRNYSLGINRSMYFSASDSQAIVDAQTQTTNAVNSMNQTISDTNSTSESSQASDFFHDYNETAQDGIIAIVNMPLNIFNALTLGSTEDLCFNLKGKQVCLPSGDIIWGKTNRTSIHSGNATFTPHPFSAGGSLSEPLSLFKGLFNLVVGGYLCYKMLKSLMRITNDMLNPTKDKLEVLEL